MRFHITALILGSGLALTTANHTAHHRNQSILLQQNLDIVPMLPEACSLAACLNLTAQLTCIANAIVNGDPAALQKCLTTSMTQICSCIACIPALNNVLMALGICPVVAPTPPEGDEDPGHPNDV